MYLYKLKEDSYTPSGFEVGDVEIAKGRKSTVTDVDPKTGAVSWDIEHIAAFESIYKTFDKLRELLKTLEREGEAKDDTTVDSISSQANDLFNKFRTHVRKTYPEAYKRLLRLKEEEVDEGEGIGYNTPRAFDKNKKSTGAPNIYYYKLGFKPVPKKIKGAGTIVKKLWEKESLNEFSDFQQKRINAFDELEENLNQVAPLMSNAKSETVKYYNENPGSYEIVYSTDMIEDYVNNIIELLKQEEE